MEKTGKVESIDLDTSRAECTNTSENTNNVYVISTFLTFFTMCLCDVIATIYIKPDKCESDSRTEGSVQTCM